MCMMAITSRANKIVEKLHAMRAGNCAVRSLSLLRDCSVFLSALQRNGPNITQQAMGELAVIAVHNHTADHLCSNQTLCFTDGVRRCCPVPLAAAMCHWQQQCEDKLAVTPWRLSAPSTPLMLPNKVGSCGLMSSPGTAQAGVQCLADHADCAVGLKCSVCLFA